jgi:hypothetical protein
MFCKRLEEFTMLQLTTESGENYGTTLIGEADI